MLIFLKLLTISTIGINADMSGSVSIGGGSALKKLNRAIGNTIYAIKHNLKM